MLIRGDQKFDTLRFDAKSENLKLAPGLDEFEENRIIHRIWETVTKNNRTADTLACGSINHVLTNKI
jgi:hypothetical protein